MRQHVLDCSEDTFLGVIILHHLKSNATPKEIADEIYLPQSVLMKIKCLFPTKLWETELMKKVTKFMKY